MLIDLRYHLISLVAVFLALAVGIIVGSSIIAGSSIEGLQNEFIKLRAENRQKQQAIDTLRERNERYSEFDRAIAPFLVNNRLNWQRVAIIQTGDYSEATQSVKYILEEAGARVTSVTTLSNFSQNTEDEKYQQIVQAIKGVDEIEELQDIEPIELILETLANAIVSGDNSNHIDTLERKKILTKAGEYERGDIRVILVGGSKFSGNDRPNEIDLMLIDKLLSAGAMTIVGVEPLEVTTSYIPAYQLKAIPTVDNVDQLIGQVALVFAVGGENGNFGVKKTSDRIAPAFLESGQWRGSQR